MDLSRAGVSEKVITYMISTANATTRPVTAAQPPPSAPVETVVVAPGPDYVWAGGEWVWDGGSWAWIGGCWVLPPRPHVIWIGARWEQGPHGWYRVPGHWR